MAPRSLVGVTNDRLRSHLRGSLVGPGVFGPQLSGPVTSSSLPMPGGGGGVPTGGGFDPQPGSFFGTGCNMGDWACLAQQVGQDVARGLAGCRSGESWSQCLARKAGDVFNGNGGGQDPGGNGGVQCGQGFVNSNGQCVPIPGGNGGQPGQGVGNAPVRGRYGAGIVPISIFQEHRDCPTGMVLGKDNICYDHLRKSERKWPPPRKPLLTGGERNAITTAKRAMRKIVRTRKDFREVRNLAKKAAK